MEFRQQTPSTATYSYGDFFAKFTFYIRYFDSKNIFYYYMSKNAYSSLLNLYANNCDNPRRKIVTTLELNQASASEL
jgi:hypothetical protein